LQQDHGIEAGKIEIDPELVRIDNLLRDLRDSFTEYAKSKGLFFSIAMDESTPVVIWSDHKRLRQILINIIGNAVKFTSRGAVSLHVAGKIRAIDQRRTVSFVVKDTGIGLSKEESEQLFQPFVQIRRAGTKKTPGTGLGLVLARQLARLLGGDISLVESQPEKGSTFEITIDPGPPLIGRTKPKVHEQPATLTELQQTTSNRLDGLNILLAEDTPDQALLIGFFLKDLGAKVETVENGADAVNRSLANNFDLILMDMQMPILSGFDATQLLRRRGFTKPIVALTAQAMKEDQEKCLASGCTAHLAKPFTQENLIKTIRGCFRPRETPPESHLH
jgi:CheY-like chemotaxis protein